MRNQKCGKKLLSETSSSGLLKFNSFRVIYSTLVTQAMPVAVVIIVCWVFLRKFLDLDPDWHHDGILLKPALDVAAGDTLFRDVFSQYGLLTTWLHALTLKIAEPTLLSLRLFQAVIFTSCGLLIYLITRLMAPSLVAIGVVVFWLLLSPYPLMSFFLSSSSIALFLVLLGILGLAYSESRIHTKIRKALLFAFLSGFFFALAFWARQPVGITLASSGAATIVLWSLSKTAQERRHRLYQIVAFTSGGAACLVFGLLFLVGTSSIHDWWIQSILAAQRFAELSPNGFTLDNVIYRLFPQPQHVYGSIPTELWRFLPIWMLLVCGAVFLVSVFQSRVRLTQRLLLVVSFASIGSWTQYFPIPDIGHVFWASTPMLPLAVVSLYLILDNFRSKRVFNSFMTLVVVTTLLLPNMSHRLDAWFSIKKIEALPLTVLGEMYGSDRFFETLNWAGTNSAYLAQLHRFDTLIQKLHSAFPEKVLLTFTEDAFTPSLIPGGGPHPIFLWWPWLVSLYPGHDDKVGSFIVEKRPFIEIKTNQSGGWSWIDSMSEHRVRYGFSNYRPLLRFTLGEHGERIILADPETISAFHQSQSGAPSSQ